MQSAQPLSTRFPVATIVLCYFAISAHGTTIRTCDLGTFLDNVTGTCAACAPGEYAKGSTSINACAKCPLGTASSKAGATCGSWCTECQVGSYADKMGMTNCTMCPHGTSTTAPKSTSPEDCVCAFGFFQRAPNAVPVITVALLLHGRGMREADFSKDVQQSFKQAIVKELGSGYKASAVHISAFKNDVAFGLRRAGKNVLNVAMYIDTRSPPAAQEGSARLRKVLQTSAFAKNWFPAGSYDAALGHPVSTIKITSLSGTKFRDVATGKVKYDLSGFTSRTSLCHVCPEGATCNGGTDLPQAKEGYFKVTSESFYSCSPRKACKGGKLNACHDGNTGQMCASCNSGHYLSAGLCKECTHEAFAIIVFVFLALLILCALLTKFSQGKPNYESLEIGENYIQMLVLFVAIDFNWPSFVTGIFEFFSFLVFDIDVLQSECVTNWDYRSKYIFSMLLPIVVAIIFACLFFTMKLARICGAPMDWFLKEHLRGASSEFAATWAGMVSFLVIAYIFMAEKSLELFNCTTQPNGVRTLVAQPSLECFEGEHAQLVPLGVFGLMIYTVSFPAACIVVLYRNRENLFEPSVVSRWGVLYTKFHCVGRTSDFMSFEDSLDRTSNLYFWEVVLMLRKLLFALTQFIAAYASVQSMCIVIVLQLAIFAQFWWRPYYKQQNNVLDIGLLFSLCITLWTADLRSNETLPDAVGSTVTIFMGISIVVALLALAFVLLSDSRRVWKVFKFKAPDGKNEDEPTDEETAHHTDTVHDHTPGQGALRKGALNQGMHESDGNAGMNSSFSGCCTSR